MDNSFFVFTNQEAPVEIERFHICTWEFDNDSSLVEFGFEIAKSSLKGDLLSLSLYIPWFSKQCVVKDLYSKLSVSENSRFIFNDSINNTNSLDGGKNKLGVIHVFSGRNELCLLPISFDRAKDKVITIDVNLRAYNEYKGNKPNIYFRFWIEPKASYISMRKGGISKATVIYDIKINERRNIPDEELEYFSNNKFCKINNCFSFNILPNRYDIVFFDNSSLKNVRTLEYESFNKYLGDKRLKKDELIVVFNKKKEAESYSFFSIYTKERIGTGQFALAVLINIICGVLLFIPGYRRTFNPEIKLGEIFSYLPTEIFIALFMALSTLLYFTWPLVSNAFKNIMSKNK